MWYLVLFQLSGWTQNVRNISSSTRKWSGRESQKLPLLRQCIGSYPVSWTIRPINWWAKPGLRSSTVTLRCSGKQAASTGRFVQKHQTAQVASHTKRLGLNNKSKGSQKLAPVFGVLPSSVVRTLKEDRSQCIPYEESPCHEARAQGKTNAVGKVASPIVGGGSQLQHRLGQANKHRLLLQD